MKILFEHHPVEHLVCILGLGCALVSGCQSSEAPFEASTQDRKEPVSVSRSVASSSAVQALDLQVSDDMMQRLVGMQKPALAILSRSTPSCSKNRN